MKNLLTLHPTFDNVGSGLGNLRMQYLHCAAIGEYPSINKLPEKDRIMVTPALHGPSWLASLLTNPHGERCSSFLQSPPLASAPGISLIESCELICF
ncbi:hypothetical protein M413DRAFT_319896 [Hebeloma cylindrosporum]|uniref:Uncharacterized protein n=1 Tax=Hebeloma cylindrosporum TaxID=76867 RepID=A0A0C2Y5G0_HEBCY|nr:hypothetical protein M413DRAFT_319896 [Hebeloma cylindrosporum h7]